MSAEQDQNIGQVTENNCEPGMVCYFSKEPDLGISNIDERIRDKFKVFTDGAGKILFLNKTPQTPTPRNSR